MTVGSGFELSQLGHALFFLQSGLVWELPAGLFIGVLVVGAVSFCLLPFYLPCSSVSGLGACSLFVCRNDNLTPSAKCR